MSPTRFSQQPLQIYQDPVTSFDHGSIASAGSAPNTKKSPLRPIKNAASRRNIVFNPPQAGPNKKSPLKSAQQSSSSPSRAPFGSKLNMVSMPPPGGSSFDTDSMEKKQPLMSKFKTAPQKALFTTFSSGSSQADKENFTQTSLYPTPIAPYHDGLSRANFSLEGLYGPKPATKRTLMDAAPINESRPSKRTKVEVLQDDDDMLEFKELPTPESFPTINDDGTKPAHSYAQLIGMAILRAPGRRLTLAQIYKWISDTYTFYNKDDAGWQNSIRHNLSLNKAFIKQERPKDDPGKGNYWAIESGLEHQFINAKATRNQIFKYPNESISTQISTNMKPASQPELSQFKPIVSAPQELPPPPPQQTYTLPEPQLPAVAEISSDATIPISDSFNTDPEQEEEVQDPVPSSPLIQSSPPMTMMHSSPPIPRQIPKRHDTPPPVPRFPSSSRTRSHKRKYASMDDSGYFSSLDSSALRPRNGLLLSEADRPRIRRGRAEEEIARLRGSSYDSPTKQRPVFTAHSSSPMRRVKNDNKQMLPPLTPAVKLKAPVRPPTSVSPNTNLRLHRDRVREMVGSPLRGMMSLEENMPWSPAFQLDDTPYMFQDFSTDFDIFTDPSNCFLSVPGNGSPEKRSAKRPRLDRSRSANILADISNTPKFNKSITSTPILKLTPSLNSTSIFHSPLKGLNMGMGSPSKLVGIGMDSPIKTGATFDMESFLLPQDDFLGSEFLVDQEIEEGWDIMAGFQKIGSEKAKTPKFGGSSNSNSNPNSSSRPGIGRSFTSRF